jgi:hypothetical protein
VTLAVPEAGALKVEVHVADAVVPLNVHVVNVPPVIPVSDNETVPVGVRNVPATVLSVTVTVQVSGTLMLVGVVQLTVVVVVRGLTRTLVVPLLAANDPETPG